MSIRDIDVYLNERYIDSDGDVETGVTSVNGMMGDVVIEKKHIGLENVDNTSDLNKPISTAVQTALNAKANNTDLVSLQNGINSNEVAIQSVADDLSDFASQTATNLDLKADKTGNIASATKLETARTINGILFDGTENITITADPNAHTHIVEMDSGSIVPVESRTADKMYYVIKDTVSLNNGTSTVSNMNLV